MVSQAGTEANVLSMQVTIPPKAEAQLRATLNKIDPGVRRQLSNALRRDLKPIAAQVAAGVPAKPPLSKMATNWGSASAKVATFPMAGPGRAIATIKVFGDSTRFAKYLSLTELAGSVTPAGFTPSGRHMIHVLQDRHPLVGRGGRFVWKAWLKARPKAVAMSIDAINAFVAKFNGRGM